MERTIKESGTPRKDRKRDPSAVVTPIGRPVVVFSTGKAVAWRLAARTEIQIWDATPSEEGNEDRQNRTLSGPRGGVNGALAFSPDSGLLRPRRRPKRPSSVGRRRGHQKLFDLTGHPAEHVRVGLDERPC